MSKHSNTATTIINIVAKDPSSTASTLYQYFQFYLQQEPSGEEVLEFLNKQKDYGN